MVKLTVYILMSTYTGQRKWERQTSVRCLLPRIYGLRKIHKTSVPLHPIVATLWKIIKLVTSLIKLRFFKLKQACLASLDLAAKQTSQACCIHQQACDKLASWQVCYYHEHVTYKLSASTSSSLFIFYACVIIIICFGVKGEMIDWYTCMYRYYKWLNMNMIHLYTLYMWYTVSWCICQPSQSI